MTLYPSNFSPSEIVSMIRNLLLIDPFNALEQLHSMNKTFHLSEYSNDAGRYVQNTFYTTYETLMNTINFYTTTVIDHGNLKEIENLLEELKRLSSNDIVDLRPDNRAMVQYYINYIENDILLGNLMTSFTI